MNHEGQLPQGDSALLSETTIIVHALDQWSMLLGRQFGPLSRPQRRMLLALAHRSEEEGPMRVSELADHLGLSAAGATRMLDTLEGLGYLMRFRARQVDQRQVYVQLTPAGEQALAAANQVILQRVRDMVERLTSTERATLAVLLHKLIDPEQEESL
jgi:DNA-binding MarR family transcriptional regulator